jgi:dTDP-4-amino-4,6-dideoxygalactose transaminase
LSAYTIPFNKPTLSGNEMEYMRQSVEQRHISGDGAFTRRCHMMLEEALGVPKVLLTTSCTHALEMSAILLDIQPGDEVIFPDFTFVSTVNAYVLRGAIPVFVDVRPDTLNLDEAKLEAAITPRTRAIVVVHYAGVGCEMDSIMAITSRHSIAVVEDNAHGLFGAYKGQALGTFGAMSTLSFHETKNFTCGEGGALLINEPQYIERAEIVREKGTNRSRFFRGEVDKYSWVDIGSSYLPSDMLAAFLAAQLESRAQIQAKRQHIWEYYAEHLAAWADENSVTLPTIPPHCSQSYHMFYILMPSQEQRHALITHLKERGILSVFHYLPLHLSDMGLSFGGQPGDYPITENISDRLLRLPFYNSLSDDDLASVIEAIKQFDWSLETARAAS